MVVCLGVRHRFAPRQSLFSDHSVVAELATEPQCMGPPGEASSCLNAVLLANPGDTSEFKAEEPEDVSPCLALLGHQWEMVECA